MKIELNSPAVNQPPADRVAKPISTASSVGATTITGDHATLNSASSSVASLVTKALQTPEIRQDKVDAVRQSISNGSYQIDPKQIADAMIANKGE